MYKKLARIGPISCGIFYSLMMLLMVIIMALVGFLVSKLFPGAQLVEEGQPDPFAMLVEALNSSEGLQSLAISLATMLIVGFVVGFLGAIIYNIVAMITGGIKVKTVDLGYDDI